MPQTSCHLPRSTTTATGCSLYWTVLGHAQDVLVIESCCLFELSQVSIAVSYCAIGIGVTCNHTPYDSKQPQARNSFITILQPAAVSMPVQVLGRHHFLLQVCCHPCTTLQQTRLVKRLVKQLACELLHLFADL